MINLGVATVRFAYPRLADEELAQLALALFDVAEASAREFIRIRDVQTVLELEEGSLKARSRYFGRAAAVAAFLVAYGEIREGADYISRDVLAAGKFVIEHLPEKAGVSKEEVISARRSPTLQRRIEGIMLDVEIGEITAEEGTRRLVKLLDPEDEGVLPPHLIGDLQHDLRRVQERSELRRPPPRAREGGGSSLELELPGLAPAVPHPPGENPADRSRRREYPDPFRPRRIVVVREGPDNRKVVRTD